MKILELCLSSGLGGLELYFARTIKQLSNLEIEYLAVIRPKTRLDTYLSSSQYVISHLNSRSRYVPLLSAKIVAQLIDTYEIDIIHMHWAKDLALAVLAKKFSQCKPKLVYTRHMEISGNKNDLYHRLMYSNVDMLICITRRLRDQAVLRLPVDTNRVKVLYYGTPTITQSNDICNLIREKCSIDKQAFLIGMVGRLEPPKGQHILIKAIAELHTSKAKRVDVLFIGQGKTSDYQNSLIDLSQKLNVHNQIHFYGFHPDPPSLMVCFDLVVLTTFKETFGLVLIEAMSAGTAVIGTEAGGVLEIIDDGNTGFLVEPGNVKELANVIEKLVEDPIVRKTVATNGQKFARSKFNIDNHYGSLINLFKSLLT